MGSSGEECPAERKWWRAPEMGACSEVCGQADGKLDHMRSSQFHAPVSVLSLVVLERKMSSLVPDPSAEPHPGL